jgi:pilus assembly protein FimV
VFGADFKIGGGATEANEVDPIAEADVYIAYGRDVQAEEILREALQQHPERQAIRLKLLEIYASRQDANGFRTIAEEMHAQTGGQGADWLQATAMGRQLDPGNHLYLTVADDAAQAAGKDAPDVEEAWHTLDPAQNPATPPPAGVALNTLELPLDSFPAPAAGTPIQAPASAAAAFEATAIRLDSDDESPVGDVPPVPAAKHAPLDFDLSDISLDLKPQAPADSHADLPQVTPPAPVQAPRPAQTLAADLNLPGLPPVGSSLDTTLMSHSTMTTDGLETGRDLQIKLDLARAYIEIGDKEGARELLQEVLAQADGDLHGEAKAMLQHL